MKPKEVFGDHMKNAWMSPWFDIDNLDQEENRF